MHDDRCSSTRLQRVVKCWVSVHNKLCFWAGGLSLFCQDFSDKLKQQTGSGSLFILDFK